MQLVVYRLVGERVCARRMCNEPAVEHQVAYHDSLAVVPGMAAADQPGRGLGPEKAILVRAVEDPIGGKGVCV